LNLVLCAVGGPQTLYRGLRPTFVLLSKFRLPGVIICTNGKSESPLGLGAYDGGAATCSRCFEQAWAPALRQQDTLISIFFQNLLYSSNLAILQPHFNAPVMFGSAGQNIFYNAFCKYPGALVFF
jgi:hypothetical protein